MIEEVEGELRIKGRGISKGKVKGMVLKSLMPLSFAQDISFKNSEILAEESEIHGTEIKDRVFVLPSIRHTEKYPNTLNLLKERKLQPTALVAESLDVPVIQDAINSDLPAVDRIDTSLFETGDDVDVNGTSGAVDLRNVTLKNITTSIMISKSKILILKRSDDVGTYKGRWACVSGYIEKGETADETALREISEELGLERDDIEFVRKGKVLYARDETLLWAIHPFLFETKKPDIKLDWEHDIHKWIFPKEAENYETVPKLKEAIESVLMNDRS
jgi:predicted aconitase with swiveling domain/8-oxo-dGTP pyrophosphatase MutT (NUDIX family)